MANRRAAVVIGVNKTGGLTPLKSAASNAASVAKWLRKVEPGYDVTLLTDSRKPVKYSAIENAIFKYTSLPPRYELLLVYFSGHGLYHNRSDIWLLSEAPERPREAVSLNAAIDLAKYCGIANVIFVSDACRSLSATVQQANLNPGDMFPTHAEIENSTTKVDSFRATGRGTSAFEGKIGDEEASFLTHAFRLAYRKPRAEMVHPVEIQQKTIRVVPNRRLEDFLQDTIDEAIAIVDDRLDQQIEVSVPSEDGIFIAPVEEAPARSRGRVAAAARSSKPAAREQPLSVSIPSPRSGTADNLRKLPGVGPSRERALNDVGVFHFDQIADMPSEDRKWLDEKLGSFKGVVSKFDWKSAAKRLVDDTAEVAPRALPRRRDNLARAAANRVLAELELKARDLQPDMNARVDEEIAARIPGDERVAFESETGLLVHGAAIADAVIGRSAGSEWLEILDHGDGQHRPAIIRFWDLQPGASAAVRLVDGRSIMVPGLRGYIGHAHIAEAGMKTLNYVPSANTQRFHEYEIQKDKIEKLRAAVALASEHGAFRLGSSEKADRIGAHIRVGKAIDPTLGVYAAHAYSEASDDASVRDVLEYMRSDLSVDLFDVWMLAHRWPENSKPLPIYPACPLLTQAWSLTGVKGIRLAGAVAKQSANLANSLWTTFGPGAFDDLAQALQQGDIT